MEIQGHFTQKGLALLAKLSAGSALTITRVVAGSGHTTNPASATALPSIRQSLAVNTASQSGNTATIPATLAAVQASANYALTELGVYAKDPDEGEILYKLYQLSEPVNIAAGSRQVLRFYLEETVSENSLLSIICSPAGLITEEVFRSVTDKLEQISAPVKNITLDASELPAYLNSLPRLVTDLIYIKVTGTLTEELYLHHFFGSGAIRIYAESYGSCTFQNRVTIRRCHIPIYIWDIAFEEDTAMSSNQAQLEVDSCSGIVYTTGCSFTGMSTSGTYAARAVYGSKLILDNVKIDHANCAVEGERGSIIAVRGESQSDFHDNVTGAYVVRGSIIMLSGSVPDTLGGSTNIKNGGMITKADGTLL